MRTLVVTAAYVLYLCIESSQTCHIARYKVIATPPQGIFYPEYSFGERAACLSQAAELSKATPNKNGQYFLAPNMWYECRVEKAEDYLRRQQEGICKPDYKVCE